MGRERWLVAFAVLQVVYFLWIGQSVLGWALGWDTAHTVPPQPPPTPAELVSHVATVAGSQWAHQQPSPPPTTQAEPVSPPEPSGSSAVASLVTGSQEAAPEAVPPPPGKTMRHWRSFHSIHRAAARSSPVPVPKAAPSSEQPTALYSEQTTKWTGTRTAPSLPNPDHFKSDPNPSKEVWSTRLQRALQAPRYDCEVVRDASHLHAQVIHLPRNVQRAQHTLRSLHAQNIPYTLFNGTDAMQPIAQPVLDFFVSHSRLQIQNRVARPGEGPDPALVERVKAGQEPKKKQLYKRERDGLYMRKKIGCSLSHMRVLLQSLVHGWPLTMVLEDDAELSPDFFPQLQQVLCKLPRDWDVLFLAECLSKGEEHPMLRPGVAQYHGSNCNIGYVFRPGFAVAVLPHMRHLDAHTDQTFRFIIRAGFAKAFLAKPFLVGWVNVSSSIETFDWEAPQATSP